MKLPRLFSRPSPVETKESAASHVMVMTPGQPVWTKRDYAEFAEEAYVKNVVGARCISSVAEAIGSLSLIAYKGKQELSQHWATELISKPNPMQSGKEYMEARTSFYMIAGNAYDERVTATGPQPQELYTLRPDRVQIVPSATGMVEKYIYEANGKKVAWEVDSSTGKSDILHTKTFHPTDDWYGLSYVESGAYSVDIHNQSMAWMMGLLQNSARPSGAMVYDQDGKSMTEEQFTRMKSEMEATYQGASNAGRPMLLEGGLTWTPMGLSPDDMGLIEQKNSAARDVCLSFGVPPMLIGIPGDNTYANYAEARLAFWEDTVLPLSARLLDGLAEWLTDGEIEIRPDLDKIPAIVDKRKSLWTMLDQTTSLTINEKREAMGYGPIAGGDTLDTQSPAQPDPMEAVDAQTKALIAGYEMPALKAVK